MVGFGWIAVVEGEGGGAGLVHMGHGLGKGDVGKQVMFFLFI